MKTVGLYIASVTSLGNGKYRLNDCWVESNYDEIRINDFVADTAGNQFLVTDYQNAPQRAQENLWLEVEWPDYPNTDVAPLDNSATQDYDSTIGSLTSSGYTPEISYLCRIASSANSYPAYHYSMVLTDARAGDPGAQLGAVGDYVIDKTGQIFEIVEWNGWEQPLRVKDIEERPHASDGSTRPLQYEYAYLYRPTEDGKVLAQGELRDLGDAAQDGAITFGNTEIWKSRGISISKDALNLENVTKLTIGDGIDLIENQTPGWIGGKSIELSSSTVLEGAFTSATRQTFTATVGQTSFTVDYEIGYLDVYMNGFKLVRDLDFYANNGTQLYLDTAANENDIIDVISYDTFTIANHYTTAQVDSSFVPTVGNTTIDGELTANAFNLASARIFKENIIPFTASGIELVNGIDVMSFNYKSDKEKTERVGFIADDTTELLAGEEHNYFDMGNTVGVLLKAVQELTAKVKELEEK